MSLRTSTGGPIGFLIRTIWIDGVCDSFGPFHPSRSSRLSFTAAAAAAYELGIEANVLARECLRP